MRKELHIASYLISAVFICILWSCGPSMEEQQDFSVTPADLVPNNNENQMEEAFETDTLSNEQLNVFQQRAQQKLEDFINYIEIISNKTYDSELRLVARNQIVELFADSSILVNVADGKLEKNPKPVSLFLNEIYQSEYDSIRIKTDSVVVHQPIKTDEVVTYIGYITAKVNIKGYKNGQVSFNSVAIQKAKTIIRKTKKRFGEETRTIWTVGLGELER